MYYAVDHDPTFRLAKNVSLGKMNPMTNKTSRSNGRVVMKNIKPKPNTSKINASKNKHHFQRRPTKGIDHLETGNERKR